MCAVLVTLIDRCRSELPNSKRARRVKCSLPLTAKTFRKHRKPFFSEQRGVWITEDTSNQKFQIWKLSKFERGGIFTFLPVQYLKCRAFCISTVEADSVLVIVD